MKKTLLLLSLIGGLASASAATYNISNQDNNLFLGFYAADEVNTKSVLINLGTSADVSRGFTLDLSSASSALSTTYGTNWFNNSQVYWGLIGYDGELYQNGSFYVARPTSQPLLKNANDSTTLNEDNYFTLSDKVGALIGAQTVPAAQYSTVLGSAGNTHQISIVDNNVGSSFAVVANSSYDTFTSTVYDQVGSGLNIQQFTYDGAISYPTTFQGTFGGVSQFNGVITVVPEPSTYALIGLGSLLLILAYRRRA